MASPAEQETKFPWTGRNWDELVGYATRGVVASVGRGVAGLGSWLARVSPKLQHFGYSSKRTKELKKIEIAMEVYLLGIVDVLLRLTKPIRDHVFNRIIRFADFRFIIPQSAFQVNAVPVLGRFKGNVTALRTSVTNVFIVSLEWVI